MEFSFDSRLTISKQESSHFDDVTSLLDISLLRGFDGCDTLEWSEIENSSTVFCTLFWSKFFAYLVLYQFSRLDRSSSHSCGSLRSLPCLSLVVLNHNN